MIKMKLKKNCSSVSYGGDEYIPDSNGLVLVPPSARHELEAHGHAVYSVDQSDESDEDPVDGDIDENPDTMSKDEMVAFLKGRDVPIPRGLTKGDLREMVKEAMAEAAADHSEE